jgi:hypothetical protein
MIINILNNRVSLHRFVDGLLTNFYETEPFNQQFGKAYDAVTVVRFLIGGQIVDDVSVKKRNKKFS